MRIMGVPRAVLERHAVLSMNVCRVVLGGFVVATVSVDMAISVGQTALITIVGRAVLVVAQHLSMTVSVPCL